MTRFYHGGPPGLSEILPPALSGAASTADYGGGDVCRRDRIYVTSSFDCAAAFASVAPPNGSGVVYQVEPIGEVEPDPDCLEEGLSFAAVAVRIVRVIPLTGKQLKKGRRRLLGMAA